MNKLLKIAIASCLTLAAATSAYASDKLQDILSANKIRIGVLSDAAPWGFKGADGQLQGLDIDLSNLLAKEMGVKADIVQVTGASRIPSLLSNKVDILIAAAGATPQRALQVMFSQPYAAVDLGVYGGPKMNASKEVSGLDGQSIAVAKGSTLDVWLTDNAKGAKVMRFEDTPGAIKAFLSGQAAAFAENSAISQKVEQDNPNAKLELKFLIRQSPAHIMVAQGDQNLLNWINTFLFSERMSGDLSKLQAKWFGKAQELPLM
jgi:polar amino acid transport system substrate-binding protein